MSLFDTGVIPAINDHIRAEAKKERDYGDYWSASSAGYCMRLVMMRRLGVPPVPEIDKESTQRVFSAGHVFHEWIQRITKDAGLSIASEVELQDEDLMIRGHFDDLVLVDGKLILYDYKTAQSKWFEYVKGRPISHYNKMQLGTYMYMLRKQEKWIGSDGNLTRAPAIARMVTEARILKISKDDLRLHEQQLLWTPELEKEVVGYWRTLNGYWEKKTLPKCTCLDIENGFMGKRSKAGKVYNDYFYNNEPCSIEWYELKKKEQK